MQKTTLAGADPERVKECAELARQVTVQKKLTDRIVANYETVFFAPDDGEEIPEVVRTIQITTQEKVKHLTELAESLGVLDEPCMRKILGSKSS